MLHILPMKIQFIAALGKRNLVISTKVKNTHNFQSSNIILGI